MREHATTNRVLLALIGLVMLGGGLVVLAGGADIYRRWDLAPPAGWPLTTPQSVLIPQADQASWSNGSWWWPTVIAGLALLMLLALLWLLSQTSWRRNRDLLLVSHTAQSPVAIRDDVLADALTADLDLLPGTSHASASVHGSADHPRARIRLTLKPGSLPEHVLKDAGDAVERVRRSADWEELSSHIHLDVARHGARRAE
jgi:hypothetical protein